MDKKDYSSKTKTVQSSGEAARTIGSYHLLQKIGEGGMGEVWVAEQQKPIRRKVALKLIKAGMDTKQVIARFESERQALALMDHPAIAKVFEAGETEEGRPYFVMEYVQGIPITAHCDQNRLTTQERLELFKHICEGVQHAHQKAVIHRDLKPSNILVAIQDGKAVPKIIDFGVAKATAQSLTERTMYTELGMMVGTPEYMSPEQAEMSGQNVDTRTDVYSLGAILYELLVGALPFDPKELRRAGFDEIRRRIREVDPPRPSTRLSTMGEASTTQAQNRRTERPALIRQLRGDLDWITMKALEKDRTRRYGSPAELEADIDRYLHHQPVVARPPNTVYKARKFVRRHRVGVGVAATLALLLVAFSVMTALQARRIARERDRANQEAETSKQVSDFMVNLFKVSDPSEARGNSITAREILDKGAEKIETGLAGQPLVQARLMLNIANVYINLGLYRQAQPLAEKSLEIRRRLLGDDALGTLDSTMFMGNVFLYQTKYAQAEVYYRKSMEGMRRFLGADNQRVLAAVNNMAVVLLKQGKLAEAQVYLQEVLDGRRRLLGEQHSDTLSALSNFGAVMETQGKLAEAEKCYREALSIGRSIQGNDHPKTLVYLKNLGRLLHSQNKLTESEKYFRETLEAQRRVLGEDHPETLTSRYDLADILADQGNITEAGRQFREILQIQSRILPKDHTDIADTLIGLGRVLNLEKKYAEAEAKSREGLSIFQRALAKDALDILSAMSVLGESLAGQRKFTEAEPFLLEGASGLVESSRTSARSKRQAIEQVIKLYLDWGKPDKAAGWRAKLAED